MSRSDRTRQTRGHWSRVARLLAVPILLALVGPADTLASGVASEAVQAPVPDSGQLAPEAATELASVLAMAAGDALEIGSLAAFWGGELGPTLGSQVTTPTGFHPYTSDELPASSCEISPDEAVGNAFYCPAEQSIWFDWELVESVAYDYGITAALAVVAHEYGHHIQTVVGLPTLSIRAELQADCFAGLYLRYLDDLSYLNENVIPATLMAMWSFGDDALGSSWRWSDPEVHGQKHQRRRAAGIGFTSGDIRYCQAYDALAEQPPIVLDDRIQIELGPGMSASYQSEGSIDFKVFDSRVRYWRLGAIPGLPAENRLFLEVVQREPSAIMVGDVWPTWVDSFGWALGDGAWVLLDSRDPATNTLQAAAAGILVDDDGAARLFIAAMPMGIEAASRDSVVDALYAVLWGYCDRDASQWENNCPAREAPDEREGPSPPKRRDREAALKVLVPDVIRGDCRPYRGHGEFDPFDGGADVAVDCQVGSGGIRNFAYFAFPDSDELSAYYAARIADIPLEAGSGGCRNGRRGETTWAHGRIACWVTQKGKGNRLARIRWTDDRYGLYGVLSATDRDLGRLYDWWSTEVESGAGA